MIVGTAGHIDHGKTTLVKALTGVDTDRLKEEKARGISIELGYAYQALPEAGPSTTHSTAPATAPNANSAPANTLGFVDVPGHEKFIATMLAGATGIDFALLVVAADDGVMPQTREHWQILQLLAIRQAAVVITKVDRVDTARLADVHRELDALFATASVGQGATRDVWPTAPRFEVSAYTGQGINTLRDHLHDAARAMPARPILGLPRLAIDRCFTLAGTGTVVTGTLFDGSVQDDATLMLSPSGLPVRVRGLRVHNQPATQGQRGQRCALALARVTKDQIQRGDWLVAPTQHAPSQRLDVRLRLLASESKALADNTPVHLHLGAWHGLARVSLLQAASLAPGGEALAQLVLDQPTHAAHGDLGVLRDASASRTIAGLTVIDTQGPARYRRRPERLAMLDALAIDDLQTSWEQALTLAPNGLDRSCFARNRNVPPDALQAPEGSVQAAGQVFGALAWQGVLSRLREALAAFHSQNPDEFGPQSARLRRITLPNLATDAFDAILAAACAQGQIARSGPWLHLPEHHAELSPADSQLAARVAQQAASWQEPAWVRDLSQALGHDEADTRRLMLRLMRRGDYLQIVRDLYLSLPLAQRYAELVLNLGSAHPADGFSVAQFRDACGLGRKRAIQVLEFFDRIGYTRRLGEQRKIRDTQTFAAVADAASDATSDAASGAASDKAPTSTPTPDQYALRKDIAPGGAAGLQNQLGSPAIPGGFDSHVLPPVTAAQAKPSGAQAS